VDLIHARVALRARPLIDVLDLAVRFCAANAGAYARLSGVVLVPAIAASWGVARAGGWVLGWAAVIAIAAFADAPFVALASRLVFADEARARDVMRAAAVAVPRLAVVRFAQGLSFALSLVLLGLPWLWAGSALLFLPEVVVLERSGVGAAWGRAQRVARAHLGITMAAMILLSVLAVAAALLADVAGREVLETVLQVNPPPSVFAQGGSLLALLGFWSTLPLRATCRFFVYLDVRTRTEGWDIQTRFAAIAARAAHAANPQAIGGPAPSGSRS
jgi:hypothetical protein